MSKQNQTAESQADSKRRSKARSDAASDLAGEVTEAVELVGESLRASGSNSAATPAARLGDSRLQRAQRQGLASQIGRIQGNRYLQRTIAALANDPDTSSVAYRGKNGNGTSAPVQQRSGGAPAKQAGRTRVAERKAVERPEHVPEEPESEPPESASRAVTATAEPPPDNDDGDTTGIVIQRQSEDDGPTEEEKARALAAAEDAKRAAAQTKSRAKQAVAKSKSKKSAEVEAKQAAKQKRSAAKAEAKAKAPPADAKKEPPTETKAASEQEEAPVRDEGQQPAAAEPAAPSPPATAPVAATAPAEQAPSSPEEDPGFQAVVERVKGVAAGQRTHAPAEKKAAEAQAAAVPPAGEVESKAQAEQVDEMEQAETPGFDAAAFKAQLMERIEAMSPKTAEEADSFKEEDRLSGLKGEMEGKVEEEKKASSKPLEEKTAAPPDTAGIEPKPVSPLPPAKAGAPPGSVGAESAVPKPKAHSEVEGPMQANSEALDAQMADTGVPEETLRTSNEPDMVAAVEAKHEAQEHAATAPAEYRAAEEAQLAQAQADAAATADANIQAMHSDRAQGLSQVTGQQRSAKSEDETARKKVAGDINRIYERTKSRVDTILAEMDREVEATFDEGATAAKRAFEDYLDTETEAWKQERYGGWLGWARWVKDKFKTHPRINQIAREAKNLFVREMDAVIDSVVAIIKRGIEDAKAEVAGGKKEIQNYVAKLPADLKQVGQQAAAEVAGKFDQLKRRVDAKQDDLVETLANKYQENLEAVNAKVEAYKAANQGLYDRAKDALAGVIQTIKQLKEMLTSVLSRAAAAIKGIIKDPIGFLGNLVSGIQQGLENFVGNIWTHLKKGLIGWLTGALGDAGITLPQSFDLKGIFMLVMQILGLTFDRIRSRITELLGFDPFGLYDQIMGIVGIYQEEGMAGLARRGLARILGEERITALMEVVGIFEIIQSGNLGRLWEMVQGHLSNLKEMVFGKIQEFIAEKVIKAGITWIMSLLNPAGAFVRACKMIYDIVMFFVNRGKQIMSLVDAIIGSISAIVKGNVGSMADAVENALGRAIPVAISFLASLLGLGGVSKKVKEIIESVRGMVDRALDAVFNSRPVQMVAGFIRKAVGKVKGMASAGVEKVKGFARAGVEKAKGMAKAGVGKVKGAAKAGVEKARAGLGVEKRTKEQKEQETEDGRDIKDQVRQEVKGRLNKPIRGVSDIQPVITAVYNKYKQKGLKYLDVVAVPEKPGEFEIRAAASSEERMVAVSSVLGIETEDLDLGWGTTLTAHLQAGDRVINLGKHESTSEAHAEVNLIDHELDLNWEDIAAKRAENLIVINITRSPCPNCSDELRSFVAEKRRDGYDVDLHINMLSLYGGQQKWIGARIALEELRDAGFGLSAWDVIQFLEAKGVIVPKQIPADQRAALEKRIRNIQETLDKIQGIQVGQKS